MAKKWNGHFYNEAQTHKVIYDQVSQAYEKHEEQWKALNLESTHWTEIAEVVRWAKTMAKQSFSAGYSYFVNMIEHQKDGSIFGVRQRIKSLASANKRIADWTKAALAKWNKLAVDYGVTLVCHEKDEVEIALMANYALVDIYRYTGSKWDKVEADSLIKNVRRKFDFNDNDFSIWQKARGISGGDKLWAYLAKIHLWTLDLRSRL